MKALSADWDTWYPSTYTGSTDDKINGFLSDRGYIGSLDDKLFKYMRDCGYAGGLSDMLYQYRGRNLVGAAPVLDLNFAGMSSALPSWATFTRATSENAFNASGILTSFASGAPAFAYDPVSHVALGTAWFGQATNLQTQSQLASGWAGSGAVLTLNTDTAPDGTATASTFADNSSNSAHFLTAPGVSYTSGTTYVFSHLLKAGTNNFAQLTFPSAAFGTTQYANFDLSTGTVTATGAGNVAQGIIPWGNGWYRCWIAATATASATASTAPAMILSGNAARVPAYIGTGVTLRVWGQQVETGTLPTPYKATTTAAVTGNTDVGTVPLNVTNIPANPVGLTVLWKARTAAGLGGTANAIFALSDGTTNNRVQVSRTTGGTGQAFVTIGGTSTSMSIQGMSTANADITGWFGLDGTTLAAQSTGQAQQSATAGIPTGLTTLRIGDNPSGNSTWMSTIARLIIYNRRLPDAQAAAIAASL